MQKVSIANGSPYQKELQTFKDSKLFQRLNEKFRIKPYYEQNRILKGAAGWSSYLFNLFSILIGFFFVYNLLNSFLGVIIGVILSIAMLIVLESFKRLILPQIGKDYLQFRKVGIIRVLIGIGLIVLSAFLSYQGGNTAVHHFTSKVEKFDTELISSNYSKLIRSKQEQQKQLSKVKYKGTTTRTAQKAINAIQAEINLIREQENLLFGTSLEENRKMLVNDSNRKYTYGLYFSFMALIFDLSLIFCLAYCEYYDYHSLAEFGTLPNGDTATVSTLGGGAELLINNDSTNDSKTLETVKKPCLNCGDSFDVINPKKKFCSTSCRVKNWEANNQKKLTVPTT